MALPFIFYLKIFSLLLIKENEFNDTVFRAFEVSNKCSDFDRN